MRIIKRFAFVLCLALPFVFIACTDDGGGGSSSSSRIKGMYSTETVYYGSGVSARFAVYDFTNKTTVISYGTAFDNRGYEGSYEEFTDHSGWFYNAENKRNLSYELKDDRIVMSDNVILLVDGDKLLVDGTNIVLVKWK